MSGRPTSRQPTRDSSSGESATVGVSTHNDEQVRLTLAEPVDYVAIGPVFSTSSKDRPDPVVGLDGVRRAREIVASSGRPLVAIGGITLERARSVIDAGARFGGRDLGPVGGRARRAGSRVPQPARLTGLA